MTSQEAKARFIAPMLLQRTSSLPEGPPGYLGIALYHLGRKREALEEFTRALRIDPRLRPADSWRE